MEDTFAAALRRARLDRGLTQEGLAGLAGLSAQAIGLLERGVRRFPHSGTVEKLDRALGLSVEERELFVRLASRGATSTIVQAERPTGPRWDVARQLPAATGGFVGRLAELGRLMALLGGAAGRVGAPAIATIQGMPGVGKTALAIQAAHACAEQYPDGQLYLNLRGFGSGTPLSPLNALGHLLRATGLAPEAVPDRLPDAIAAFRTRFADRRVLLLLDNAADVDQLTELIPSSSGSAVLVTSRNTLTGLPAGLHLQLTPMPVDESLGLLAVLAGTDRLDADADRVAALCGHLPLALTVAGAWLVRRPNWSGADLADRLADESQRLDLLGVDDLDVRASLSLSVDQLMQSSQQSARALILLSLTDASDFTAQTAAPLLDVSEPEADRLLERLADLHLLETRTAARYHFHDLVRTFARELAAEKLTEDERRTAIERSLTFYLAVVWRAVELTDAKAARGFWPGRPSTATAPAFTGSDQALGWIDGELPNYLALIEQVSDAGGWDEPVAGLVIGLYDYFTKRGNLADWLPAIDRVASGRVDQWTLGQLQADAAIALAELARYDESLERFGRAGDVFKAAGHTRGMTLVANNTARLLTRMRRFEEALPLAQQALELNRELGDDRAIGSALNTLCEIHGELGDHAHAREDARASLEFLLRTGDPSGVANSRLEMAWCTVGLGQPEVGVAEALQSISEFEALGHRKSLSDGRYVLGLILRAAGRTEPAIEQTELAIEIAVEVQDHRREAQTRLLLAKLLKDLGEDEDAAPNARFALDFYREHDAVLAQQAEMLLGELKAIY